MAKQILVFNCGSSSIKFSLVDPDSGVSQISGLAERLGTDQATLSITHAENKQNFTLTPGDYNKAMATIFAELKPFLADVLAVGHRVVHGGEKFKQAVIINPEVLGAIEDCISLAPLHNPANIEGIKIAKQHLADIPHIACFDTAFHSTMPELAYMYPLPYEWYEEHQVRRYGFHGISYQYVSKKAVGQLQLNPNNHAMIIAHLGNGCSACAVKNGKSVDTTMGLTPLEGLMMGTRSGSIDPGIHQYISKQLQLSIDDVTTKLNKNSGLKGVSGISHDMRDLANKGGRAQLAIDLFCYRLAKQIAGLAATLPKLDALVFTAGIGENDKAVRDKTIAQLQALNLTSTILVIPTNEEWQISQDAMELL